MFSFVLDFVFVAIGAAAFAVTAQDRRFIQRLRESIKQLSLVLIGTHRLGWPRIRRPSDKSAAVKSSLHGGERRS